jgi:glycosyltransferase involved in cell wall biosynthesis
MRILHISTRLIQGGSQENTVLSCEGQARTGHEVHLAFGPIYGPEGSMLERVSSFRTKDDRGIETHEIPDMIREVHPVRDYKGYKQLRALIRTLKPDIVHTHSSKAGVIGRAAAWAEGGKAGRIGVVHTVHGPSFHEYETKLKNRVYICAERWSAARCHSIVCVAEAMRGRYLGAGIGGSKQYSVVHSGMEIDSFLRAKDGADRVSMRQELGFGDEDIVIGTVARLAELKGHDDLLDALGEEMQRRPEWKLLWVGDGWWRERLEKRVEQLGLAGRVVITGMVPMGRVPAVVRAMDVCVHPSYREGLPRVVPQALLAGVPVVAHDVDGTGEVCVDFETGRLVAAGDHAELCGAVRWMVEHPDLAERTADAGRRRCMRMFSADKMVTRLEKVYEHALGHHLQGDE